MRSGDFSVEVVAHGDGRVREMASGQVLARPGQVYRLRLRNHGPLYAVAAVDIDGRCVTAGGLVLAPWSATELERPIAAEDDGRFTVIAEGDETVFGPDGGRDNASLGLIAARFRRELPRRNVVPFPSLDTPSITGIPVTMPPRRLPAMPPDEPGIPVAPPQWSSPRGLMSRQMKEPTIERAAGTGLTGHSDQRFEPISLGPLEDEATLIQLRLVIGTEASLAEEPAQSVVEQEAPARPAARP